MWSLPDLDAINKNALHTDEEARKALAAEHECDHCNKPATHVELVYHIFGDDPTGVMATCDEHESWNDEHYFYCARCERWHVRNYTWELYCHTNEYGEEVCLNCHREVYLEYENHWVDPAEALQWTADKIYEAVKAAPHLFAVGQKPENHELVEVGGVLIDSMDGTEAYGPDSIDNVKGKFKQLVEQVVEKGAPRFLFVLDGAYQFCCNISVYVEASEVKAEVSAA